MPETVAAGIASEKNTRQCKAHQPEQDRCKASPLEAIHRLEVWSSRLIVAGKLNSTAEGRSKLKTIAFTDGPGFRRCIFSSLTQAPMSKHQAGACKRKAS